VDTIARPLEAAAEAATRCLVDGGTVFFAGAGPDRALARYAADRLMLGAGPERPALPAVALTEPGDPAEPWREARALARPGDLLLALDSGDGSTLAGALGAAAAGNPALVLLSYDNCPGLPPADDDTVIIALPAAPRDQLLTLEAMALGCLCHLIEVNLFGA
jgi:D-sedoheptulose 7-phosphate isomerase